MSQLKWLAVFGIFLLSCHLGADDHIVVGECTVSEVRRGPSHIKGQDLLFTVSGDYSSIGLLFPDSPQPQWLFSREDIQNITIKKLVTSSKNVSGLWGFRDGKSMKLRVDWRKFKASGRFLLVNYNQGRSTALDVQLDGCQFLDVDVYQELVFRNIDY